MVANGVWDAWALAGAPPSPMLPSNDRRMRVVRRRGPVAPMPRAEARGLHCMSQTSPFGVGLIWGLNPKLHEPRELGVGRRLRRSQKPWRHPFQKETTSPPATMSVPPIRMGAFGTVRNVTKATTCQTKKSVAM